MQQLFKITVVVTATAKFKKTIKDHQIFVALSMKSTVG